MPKTDATPIGYEPGTVLTLKQLAQALQASERTVERADLPKVYLGDRTPRWIWGQVIAELERRARQVPAA